MNTQFSEFDPGTWDDANLPSGYKWVEVDPECGDSQLFAPDGSNLSLRCYYRTNPDDASPIGPMTLDGLDAWLKYLRDLDANA